MTQFPPADCINTFFQEAARLGIEVGWTRNNMNNLDAAYHALPKAPGKILLHDKTPRPGAHQLCTLLAHEMVHVLQHWKGNFEALPPLGWPIDAAPSRRNLSIQEQEAYSAQKEPLKVLKAIQSLQPIETQVSP